MRAHQGDLGFPTWHPRTTVFPVNQKKVQHCFNNNNGQTEMRACNNKLNCAGTHLTVVAPSILDGFLFAFFSFPLVLGQWLLLRAFSHTQFNHHIEAFGVENKILGCVHAFYRLNV